MAEDTDKSELIAELARARQRVSKHSRGMRREADLLRRVRSNIARNGFVWIGGAVLAGVVLAKLPARTKKVVVDTKGRKAPDAGSKVVKTGILLSALKMGLDLARPILIKWATQQAKAYVATRFAQDGDERRV